MNFPLKKGRVALYPLNPAETALYLADGPQLAAQLQLEYFPLELNADPSFLEELQAALRGYILPALQAHPEQWPWNAHWWILHPADNRCIGGLGMGGPPDQDGVTGLGYFIHREYEGQGYMSEALHLLISWLQAQPECRKVRANTLPEGTASARVLQKCGFSFSGMDGGECCWERHIR